MANREQRRAAARRKRASSKRRRNTEPGPSTLIWSRALSRFVPKSVMVGLEPLLDTDSPDEIESIVRNVLPQYLTSPSDKECMAFLWELDMGVFWAALSIEIANLDWRATGVNFDRLVDVLGVTPEWLGDTLMLAVLYSCPDHRKQLSCVVGSVLRGEKRLRAEMAFIEFVSDDERYEWLTAYHETTQGLAAWGKDFNQRTDEAQNRDTRGFFESMLGPDHPGIVEDRDENGEIVPGWFHVRGKSFDDALRTLTEMATSPK